MEKYEPAAWARLGKAVRRARKRRGFKTAQAFGTEIGRSSRQILELERGGPVGEDTLELVEQGLGWVQGLAEQVLSGRAEDVGEADIGMFSRTLITEITDERGRLMGSISNRDLAMFPVDSWEDLSDLELATVASDVTTELRRRMSDRPGSQHRPNSPFRSLAADDPREPSEGARQAAEAATRGEESQVEP